jgi:hypothetical protein
MVQVSDYEYESSQEELLRTIDEAARSRLGISGEELIDRYRSRQLTQEDRDMVVDVLVLVDLLSGEPAA